MHLSDHWDFIAALPYLAMGIGLAWLSATMILRQAARLRHHRQIKIE